MNVYLKYSPVHGSPTHGTPRCIMQLAATVGNYVYMIKITL